MQYCFVQDSIHLHGMHKNILVKSLLIAVSFMIFFSCRHQPDDFPDPVPQDTLTDCDTLNITYTGSVIPIFQDNCFSCHSGNTPEAGINLNDYEQVSFLTQSGQLMGSIQHANGFEPMPPGDELTDCEIYTIEKWINDTVFDGGNGGGIPCDPDTIYFQNEVLPLLISSCGVAGCHDPQTHSDGVILTSYDKIIETGEVVPFNPRESKIWEVIADDFQSDRMPPAPAPPLNQEQKNILFTWISQGALNNFCEEEECDTSNVSFSDDVFPVIQNNCYGCHSGGQPSGGILLTSFNEVKTAASIAPGTYGSLLGTIRHQQGNVPMPQNGPMLSECKIATIEKWVSDGMPNN